MPSDDLAPFMTPQPAPGMRFGQGKIISFDPDTLENVIEWQGIHLHNLTLIGTSDALSYAPGQTVALRGIDASGARGATQWMIDGRLFVPGSDNGAQLVDWMKTALGRQVAAAVFADRVRSDNTPFGQIHVTADQVWQDGAFGVGDTPDPGPTVEAEVTDRGAAIIILAADVSSRDGVTARMGFTTSGATTRSADYSFQKVSFTSYDTQSPDVSATQFVHYEDLNPGLHTFHAQYQTIGGPVGATWSVRSMTVIAF